MRILYACPRLVKRIQRALNLAQPSLAYVHVALGGRGLGVTVGVGALVSMGVSVGGGPVQLESAADG